MNKFFTILLLIAVGFVPATGALAFYADTEDSTGNSFSATTLDFTLRDAGNLVTSTLFNESGVVPGPDWYVEPLKVKKESGLDFDYEAWFEKTGGDDALCDELELKARHEGALVYSGPLSAFTYAAGVITGGQDDWSFELLFNNEDSSFENLSCQFDFVFHGEQIGGAGYYDDERVSNVFATGEGGVQYQDVVINEVMWMGSTVNSRDEWIELRNMTDEEIDIGKWTVDNGRSGGNSLEMVPNSHMIPPHGFLLIAKNPEQNANTALNVPVDVVNGAISLANSGNGNLILRDPFGNIVDYAKGDPWATGETGEFRKSMERNDIPGDGLLAGSWHQCNDDDGIGDDCNDGTFWDTADGNNYGTPGATNLSENDPTATAASTEEETSSAAATTDEPPATTEDAGVTVDDSTDTGGTESPESTNTEEEPEEPAIPADAADSTDPEAGEPEPPATSTEAIVEETSGSEETGGSTDSTEQSSGEEPEPEPPAEEGEQTI